MKFASFKSSALKSVGAVSLCVALGAGLVGCGGEGGAGGAVAATVNGQDIMEQTVTDYIADFRASSSLETDEAWGQWMVSNGYTPESVREEVINYYVDQDLYNQAATEYNVAVEQADVDAQMEQTKAMFESEEAFQQALEASNMTEESYIETVIRPNLLQTKLAEAVAASENEGSSDDAVLAQAQEMASQWDGAKRSSHILFASDDTKSEEELQAEAQKVLDQINAGEITFEEAAQQNSADSSASNGGDVGWDVLNQFVTEYQDALKGLETDQVSDLVKTDYGIHIIKCTDTFAVPEGGITSLDQLPTEFVDYLNYMQQSNDSQNFTTWFQEYRQNATIDIKPMPEGLPYAIDLAPYEEQAAQTNEGDAAADQAAADQAGDAAAADQAAADQAAGDQAADQAAGDQAAADQAAGDQAAADQATGDQAGEAAQQ